MLRDTQELEMQLEPIIKLRELARDKVTSSVVKLALIPTIAKELISKGTAADTTHTNEDSDVMRVVYICGLTPVKIVSRLRLQNFSPA
jgi:hypothetical protein